MSEMTLSCMKMNGSLLIVKRVCLDASKLVCGGGK